MSLENVKRFKEDVEKNEELKNKIINELEAQKDNGKKEKELITEREYAKIVNQQMLHIVRMILGTLVSDVMVVDILHIVEKVWLFMCHNCNYQNYNQIYIKDRYLYVL